MRQFLLLVISVLTLAGCASQSQGPAKILVAGNSTPQSLSTVIRSMSGPLNNAGHDVYDYTLLALDDFTANRSMSRTEAMDMARSADPRMDVLVFFSVDGSSDDRGYSREVRVTVEATALQVSSGRVLGNSSDSQAVRVRPDCDRGCAADAFRRQAAEAARNVGASLADNLGDPDRQASTGTPRGGALSGSFELEIEGFRTFEQQDIEAAITAMSGYRSHRVQYAGEQRMAIRLESRDSVSDIRRTLEDVFEQLGVRGYVQYAGSTFRIAKVTARQTDDNVESDDWDW